MFSWYQEKRRLGITSKTALFCCGSERTPHGETAAEEIGVRPIPVLVELRGVEPLSESALTRPSPGAGQIQNSRPVQALPRLHGLVES